MFVSHPQTSVKFTRFRGRSQDVYLLALGCCVWRNLARRHDKRLKCLKKIIMYRDTAQLDTEERIPVNLRRVELYSRIGVWVDGVGC